uniref:NADH dehydrogenase [ubiquinone] 1 beta subcomplex subunit 11, mitochondrial n=1 Tax=Salvator merianae TaxID=96440 RepID=A0A8D0EAZ3_SALMN
GPAESVPLRSGSSGPEGPSCPSAWSSSEDSEDSASSGTGMLPMEPAPKHETKEELSPFIKNPEYHGFDDDSVIDAWDMHLLKKKYWDFFMIWSKIRWTSLPGPTSVPSL